MCDINYINKNTLTISTTQIYSLNPDAVHIIRVSSKNCLIQESLNSQVFLCSFRIFAGGTKNRNRLDAEMKVKVTGND